MKTNTKFEIFCCKFYIYEFSQKLYSHFKSIYNEEPRRPHIHCTNRVHLGLILGKVLHQTKIGKLIKNLSFATNLFDLENAWWMCRDT